MPPKRKRQLPPTDEPPATATGTATESTGRAKSRITVGAARAPTKTDPNETPRHSNVQDDDQDTLREQFMTLVSSAERQEVSNRALKTKFGEQYVQLVPIINDLTRESRLVMSKEGDELFYTLVSEQVATKFTGLDLTARMVYQVIEKAGNMGIWTKDIRTQTNVQQQALNKIFKALESRRLIKPVKSVTAKAKKLYMLYNLTPAKELTGGPWYTELEFDHEFISELRTFLIHCVRRLNHGRGVTLLEIQEKMIQANVSRVQLSLEEVRQLLHTLALDHLIESYDVNDQGETLFVATRRVTPMCEFKWWDSISPDFHFRTIRFEDGVTLSAHEPHHHTHSNES